MHETRITRTVELDASAADVWRALTEPALLGEWLDSAVELDVRPGGDGVLVEADGAVRRAHVVEVEPDRRLALRWWPEDGSGPASTVELDLEATPDGTRVVVTETLVPPASGLATASASAAAGAHGRWGVRLLLLGCCLVRSPVACR
ncbi:MAG: SRPBCC domain-containing protein [Actinomycetota bacterium]|nr:SRPBCC domain-containing protein [Actinomycetota bacterium]